MTTEDQLLHKIREVKELHLQIQKKGAPARDMKFSELSEALDEFYFLNKLRLYCYLLTQQNILRPESLVGDPKDIRLVREVSHIVSNDDSLNPMTHIFNKIKVLFERISYADAWDEFELEDLAALLEDLETKGAATVEELLDIYSFLSNYSTKRINSGIYEYTERSFWYNNKMVNLTRQLEKEEDRKIPVTVFKNLIIGGLRIRRDDFFRNVKTLDVQPEGPDGFKNAIEWGEKFIEVYQHRLQPHDNKEYIAYSKAIIAFFKKDYPTAFSFVMDQGHSRRMFVNFNLKIIFLLIAFELEQHHPRLLRDENGKIDLELKLDNFRKALKYEKEKRKQTLVYNLYEEMFVLFRDFYHFYNKYQHQYRNAQNEQFLKKKEQLIERSKKLNSILKNWFLDHLNKMK